MKEFFQKNRLLVVLSLFVLASLGVYTYFPVTGNFQKIIAALVFFVILPMAFNQLVLRKGQSFYRLQLGNWKKGFFWALLGLIISLLIIVVLVQIADFSHKYSLPIGIEKSFSYFLFYELILVAFFTALYEFYFRGFVLFQLAPIIGRWSILVQFVLLLLLLAISGGFNWSFAPYIIFAPFAGWIAYKSNSLWYSFFGQLLLIWIIDSGLIALSLR